MIARDVVRCAALLAARHAFPTLPESLVRWSDEPQAQADGDFPQVTLSTVSLVPEGPVSKRRSDSGDGTLAQRMLQTYVWTVQVKTEGWKLDSDSGNNPVRFAHRMRFGWYLDTVAAALLDPDSLESVRTPVKMVDEVGDVRSFGFGARGHTLPVHVFEIEFRYVDHDADPRAIGIIETAIIDGTLDIVPVHIDTTES